MHFSFIQINIHQLWINTHTHIKTQKNCEHYKSTVDTLQARNTAKKLVHVLIYSLNLFFFSIILFSLEGLWHIYRRWYKFADILFTCTTSESKKIVHKTKLVSKSEWSRSGKSREKHNRECGIERRWKKSVKLNWEMKCVWAQFRPMCYEGFCIARFQYATHFIMA